MADFINVQEGCENLIPLSNRLFGSPFELEQICNGRREFCCYTSVFIPHRNEKGEKENKAFTFYVDNRNVMNVDNGRKVIGFNPNEPIWVESQLDNNIMGKDGKKYLKTTMIKLSFQELFDAIYYEENIGREEYRNNLSSEMKTEYQNLFSKIFPDEKTLDVDDVEIREDGKVQFARDVSKNDYIDLPPRRIYNKPILQGSDNDPDDNRQNVARAIDYINRDKTKGYDLFTFLVRTNNIFDINDGRSIISLDNKRTTISVQFRKNIRTPKGEKSYKIVDTQELSPSELKDLIVETLARNKEIKSQQLKNENNIPTVKSSICAKSNKMNKHCCINNSKKDELSH